MANENSLIMGQINLQRSRPTTLEVQRVMSQMGIHIMLVQEQYTWQGRTRGIESPGVMLESGHSPGAGILINTSLVSPLFLEGLSDEYQSCVSIKFGNTEVILISVYFKYGNDVGPHILQLTRALHVLKGRNVIIGGDFNARSPLWHDHRGNRTERSDAVEDLIAAQGLVILNEPGDLTTFSGAGGESNIDLTLCSGSICNKIKNWRVHDAAVVSDHRLLTFNLSLRIDKVPRETWHFKTKRADWDFFGRILRDEIRDFYAVAATEPENLGNFFNAAVVNAANTSLGRSNPKTKLKTPWWSSELTSLKSSYKRSYRNYGEARKGGCPPERESILLDDLRASRRAYRSGICEAKRAAWRSWVENVGNSNPWEINSAIGKTGKGSERYLTSVTLGAGSGDGESTCVSSTLNILLGRLVPLESVTGENDHHRQIRGLSRLIPSDLSHETCRIPPLTEAELDLIIKGLGPTKAPGFDKLNGAIIKQVWIYARQELFTLMETCLRRGIFPSAWKRGVLKIIPKGNDKPRSDPGAYRPITLLPILGKILEKIIRTRLDQALSPPCDRQFGFVGKKSTEHAVLHALDWVKDCPSKYVVGIFLDISGAFDNAWWPMILCKLKNRGCPSGLFKILADYFSERTVSVSHGATEVSRAVNMGCPQGSVLGPTLWNVLFDDLLRLPLPEGCTLVAYADDLFLLVSGGNRTEVERKAEECLRRILKWGEMNKLAFAPHKTVGLLMKGSLSRTRNPSIRVGSTHIKFVEQCRYLGVVLDRSSSFLAHVKSISSKAQSLFLKLRRISTSEWGLRSPALRLLYRCVYVAQVAYASSVWSHRLDNVMIQLALKRGQRTPLLALTGAYRTVASDALPVLAGQMPIDLEIREILARKELIKGKAAIHLGVTLTPGGAARLPALLREMRVKSLDEWQSRWDRSISGRWTHSFFPSVKARMEGAYLKLDHYVIQMLTGHGEFRGRLFSLGLSRHAGCACGEENQTAMHILWHCQIMMDAREEMLEGLQGITTRPVWNSDLVSNKVNFECLKKFVNTWVKRWDALRVAELE